MARQAIHWAATAVVASGALCALPAHATSSDEQQVIQAMQQQVEALKQQVSALQQADRQAKNQTPRESTDHPQQQPASNNQTASVNISEQSGGNAGATAATDSASTSDQAGSSGVIAEQNEGPDKSLTIGGAYTQGLKIVPANSNNRDGGDGKLGIVAINFSGNYDQLSFAAEERFGTVIQSDPSFLRFGWAAYDFGPGADKHHQVKAGYFQVPFGNLRFGYQSFWGNLTYFAGFTDNQAAGAGYKYENGPWRLDIDAFKNNNLQQNTTYGSNPVAGYQSVNGGNIRGAYTFNQGTEHSVQVSTAVRGGQLEVGESGIDRGVTSDYGTQWAATAAVDAALGNWILQGQYVDYRYNVPSNRSFGGASLPTDTVTLENYGFRYQMPASGQIFAGNIAHTFPLNWGVVDSIQLYNNYAYLMTGGDGQFDGNVPALNSDGSRAARNPTGDIQFNAAGMNISVGPVQFWLDVLTGKNSAMTFTGPNDGDWHTRYNFQMGVYFGGDVVKN